MVNDLVTINRFAELSGLTEEAIRALKKKGQIRLNVHFFKRGRRIFISIKAMEKWIRGSEG